MTEWDLPEGSGSQDFSDDIESWLRDPNNMARFQSALEGDGEALDWLPYWVASGVLQMRAKMR